MEINLLVNGTTHSIEVSPGETLLQALRSLGYFSVKHGCETGECGACAVLVDGVPLNSCVHLAAQAEGHAIQTVESIGEHPHQGWKLTTGLHPLQQAFVETGAIQCGYCTPAQILAAKHLLDHNPAPSEAQVRDALSGVLCRCTGYLKPVKAVLRAAAGLRGKPELKVDAVKLVQGKPAFTADIERAVCWLPKCCTARMPMPASRRSMPARRVPCPGSPPC
jgi:putative selenate reductase molybdopterin-binding subunit